MENNQENKEIEVIIPIDSLFLQFEEHLCAKNNNRIFFSGKFGIGKTYFLNDFLKNRKDKFEVFHLFPINYQISTNEDIIELIKYDILIELLKKLKKDGNIFQGNKVDGIKDQIILFYSFCNGRISINKFLQLILSSSESIFELSSNPNFILLSKLGRPLSDLLKLDKEFQKFKEEYKKGEKGIIEEYIKEIKDKNISETDYLSLLLNEKIKEQKQSKESVLVLDDLDRIDPDHIFRILNIFSAHFDLDNKEQPNKFGFDKIILVGDYKNIENIFYHKYGVNTDFYGYFDKFFSVEIFNFNSDRIINDFVSKIINKIKLDDKNLSDAMGTKSGYIGLFLVDVFKRSVNLETKEKINLRELLKGTRFQLLAFKSGNYYNDPFSEKFGQLVDISIKSLISIFGGNLDRFLKILMEIKNTIGLDKNKDLNAPYENYCQYMLKNILGRELEESERWRDYLIKKNVEGYRTISINDGVEKENAKLFYDLLIEYVKTGKYKKNMAIFKNQSFKINKLLPE